MQPIQINRNKGELKQQLNYLIRQEFIITYGRYKKVPLYLTGVSLVILAISVLTSSEWLIVFKGVSLVVIALAWVITVLSLVMLLIKWIKRITWRDKSITSFLIEDIKAYLTFDNDKLTFITGTYKSDINWEYYKYYGEDNVSIYIFPERNVYEALYFSAGNIGEENFEKLKVTAKSKLTAIEKRNRT